MENKRVYQVAKEFHVSSVALISMLKELKYDIKSHMSIIDDDMYASIRKQFVKQKDEALKDIQKKKKISEAIDKKLTVSEEQKEPEKPKKRKKRHRKIAVKEEEEVAPLVKIGTKKKLKKGFGEEKKGHRVRKRQKKIDIAAVHDSYKKTLASIAADSRSHPKKGRSKQSSKLSAIEVKPAVRVSEYISVNELAAQMGIPAANLIAKCMELGILVSINQRLDMDTIVLLADEFGYDVEKIGEYAEDMLIEKYKTGFDKSNLKPRPPVVTVMGHVDHGKTTLLDYIRRSSVVETESGGITQHIGAYSVTLRNGHRITFIDTPGHKAFTAMRARGAKVTDIVILIVAADDGVMPQTIEAIDHARAAGVPIIIAINKIDLPGADPERIKNELARINVLVEDWGGKIQIQEISAKHGTNTYDLLEKVLLEAEMLELKANYTKNASGVVIEAHIDRGRGSVASVLIQEGTLHVGDPFIAGMVAGNVRAMIDENGNRINQADPSMPVQIIGMDGVPKAGDSFYIVENEIEARNIAHQRRIMKREQDFRRIKRVTLTDLYDQIKEGRIQELNLIIKADVDGSVEALSDSLTQITHNEVKVNVIHSNVGAINETDVLLAAASGAIIIGFHVRPTPQAKTLANTENVDIKLYNVIYEAIDDVKKALSGLLAPKLTENVTGAAEIRNVFKIHKYGNIAGSYITNGSIKRSSKIRVIRDNIEVYEGTIYSLKRFKEDVSEVNQGFECGIGIQNFNDIKVGDIIEAFEILEEARNI